MDDMRMRLGNALLKSLVDLKERKGELNIEDVGSLFQGIAGSFNVGNKTDSFVRSEIEKISLYINRAMREIATLNPDDIPEETVGASSTHNINAAEAELNAVIAATENATNRILDATDAIQAQLNAITGYDAAIQEAGNHIAEIYDACNFQDITGQRIRKVMKLLSFMQDRIDNIRKLFDESGDAELTEKTMTDARPDAHLMSGPAMDTPSQDDIDALFASMK